MKNIAINYIVLNPMDDNVFSKIVNTCESENNKVSLVMNDFCLNKTLEDQAKAIHSKKVKVSVVNRDYEDSKNSMNIITNNFISYSDSDAMAIVYENLVFKPGIFDVMDFNLLEKYGFIYGDYDIDDTRCYLRSHAASVKLSIPFIFWSTKKIIDNISNDNVLEYVFNNYMGFHIPNSLCTVHPNEE